MLFRSRTHMPSAHAIHVIMRKHARAHRVPSTTHTEAPHTTHTEVPHIRKALAATLSRCPAMSTKEQGLALPATLLPALLAALKILPLGTRGGLRCVSFPPRTLESRASLHWYHIFLQADQKYNFNLMRASRSQVPSNLAFLWLARNRPYKFWLCPPGKPKICL